MATNFLALLAIVVPMISMARFCYIARMFEGEAMGFVFAAMFMLMSPFAGWLVLPVVIYEACGGEP